MDDSERKELIKAMKAKADEQLKKKQGRERLERHIAKLALDGKWQRKLNDAHMDVYLSNLTDPKPAIPYISHMLFNRPGEKLGRKKTRGMRREP